MRMNAFLAGGCENAFFEIECVVRCLRMKRSSDQRRVPGESLGDVINRAQAGGPVDLEVDVDEGRDPAGEGLHGLLDGVDGVHLDVVVLPSVVDEVDLDELGPGCRAHQMVVV